MMSGAIWVRDRLVAAGWEVQVAHARKVRDVAPLACKTDKVDARVLAELCRRDLVPELWVPSLEDRELRERLRRRMHLVRMRASAMNRIFGLLTQWGLRLSLQRLRAPDAMDAARAARRARGLAALDRRSAGGDRSARRAHHPDRPASCGPLARADARVVLLDTIPGVGELLGLTIASEIGDVARFGSPRKLIGYAGLAPKINQSGDRSRTGALSKAGSRTLRWAAVEAAQHAWRPSNPWHRALQRHRRPRRQEPRQGRRRAQGPDRRLARPLAPATLQARRAAPARSCLGKLPLLSGRLTAPHGIEKPRQLPRTLCADPSAEREMSTTSTPGAPNPKEDLTRPTRIKEKAAVGSRPIRACIRRVPQRKPRSLARLAYTRTDHSCEQQSSLQAGVEACAGAASGRCLRTRHGWPERPRHA